MTGLMLDVAVEVNNIQTPPRRQLCFRSAGRTTRCFLLLVLLTGLSLCCCCHEHKRVQKMGGIAMVMVRVVLARGLCSSLNSLDFSETAHRRSRIAPANVLRTIPHTRNRRNDTSAYPTFYWTTCIAPISTIIAVGMVR